MKSTCSLVLLLCARMAAAEPAILLAGQYRDGSADTPCVWNDGVLSLLPVPEGASGRTTDMCVAQGSVYVSGFYTTKHGRMACYWVDGNRIDLPGGDNGSGRSESWASGVSVYNGCVYVAGKSSGATYTTGTAPCVWANGTRTFLPGDLCLSVAASAEGVCPVGGYYGKACFWANEEEHILDLPKGATYGAATAITIVAGVTYIAGGYRMREAARSCYWVNGQRKDLSAPPMDSTTSATPEYDGVSVTDVYTDNGSVYLSGLYGTEHGIVPVYWIDEKATVLPKPKDAGSAYALAVFVRDSSVYVAGYVGDTEGYLSSAATGKTAYLFSSQPSVHR